MLRDKAHRWDQLSGPQAQFLLFPELGKSQPRILLSFVIVIQHKLILTLGFYTRIHL